MSFVKTTIQFATLVSMLSLSSCATFSAFFSEPAKKELMTAEANFAAGEKALANEQFEDAVSCFEYIQNHFPYSEYASLSDLRLSDAYFLQEKWVEAADAYDFFLRFHPQHQETEHAWFQLGMAYYNLRASNFFIFPPRHRKDQTATRESLKAFERLMVDFPGTKKSETAKKLHKELRNELAMREMEVAQFYADRKKWSASISRYQAVALEFTDTPFAPKALLTAAQIANDKLHRPQLAKVFFERLSKDYKDTEFATKISKLGKRLSQVELPNK